MTQALVDPFATAPAPAADSDDPFATPRTTFPNMDWIVGRLVLAYPIKKLAGLQSKDGKGGTYDAIQADIHVLDGPPITDGPETPLAIPAFIEDFRFNGGQFVDGMERLIGTSKPYLCRIGETPSKINAKIMARFPTVPTDAEKTLAKQYMAAKGLLK